MLKIKYLFDDYALAKRALSFYEHDNKNLDKILKEFRISSNAIYPYFNHQELCFLRMAPKSEKDIDNIKGELLFINYLNKQRFTSLEIIPNLENKELFEMDDWYVSSFKAVPGDPIEDTNMDDNIMFKYGQTLGQLHELSLNAPFIEGKWDNTRTLQFIKESFAENHASEKMIKRLEKLEVDLSKIVKTKNNYGLIHYDFEPDNVFYDEKIDKCYVIDFDDSIYSFYYFDVIRALDEIDDEEKGKKFLEGYYSARKINQDEKEMDKSLEPVLRELWSVNSYARILHALSDQGTKNPAWKKDLVKRMTQRLKKIEQ